MQKKLFYLNRTKDIAGVSGTGKVAAGVRLSNGYCLMFWLTPHNSAVVYPDMEDLRAVHCHGGNSEIEFVQDLTAFEAAELVRARESLIETIDSFEKDFRF